MKYWYETIAVTQRILLELWRRRRSLIFWLVFPVSLLFLNGFILAERANLSLAEAMEFAAPSTLVGAALFFSCLGGSIATVVSEREQHTLKRLFISPLSGTAYFLGIFLAHCFIGVGQALLVFAIAIFMGATFTGSLLVGIGIIFLSIIAYVGVGFILGTQLAKRTEDVNALVATFGVPLLILGGAFFADFPLPGSAPQCGPIQSHFSHERSPGETVGGGGNGRGDRQSFIISRYLCPGDDCGGLALLSADDPDGTAAIVFK